MIMLAGLDCLNIKSASLVELDLGKRCEWWQALWGNVAIGEAGRSYGRNEFLPDCNFAGTKSYPASV